MPDIVVNIETGGGFPWREALVGAGAILAALLAARFAAKAAEKRLAQQLEHDKGEREKEREHDRGERERELAHDRRMRAFDELRATLDDVSTTVIQVGHELVLTQRAVEKVSTPNVQRAKDRLKAAKATFNAMPDNHVRLMVRLGVDDPIRAAHKDCVPKMKAWLAAMGDGSEPLGDEQKAELADAYAAANQARSKFVTAVRNWHESQYE